MEKPAQTDHPIQEILKRRWSPRAFADRMVESEKLRSLFEAARWAPSSFNEQPWFFIVATKQKLEEHARLLSCLVEKNQQWARLAPVLMVSVAKLKFAKTGKPNRHAFHDVGLAMGNMLVEARQYFALISHTWMLVPAAVQAIRRATAVGAGTVKARTFTGGISSDYVPLNFDTVSKLKVVILIRSSPYLFTKLNEVLTAVGGGLGPKRSTAHRTHEGRAGVAAHAIERPALAPHVRSARDRKIASSGLIV